MSRVKKGQKFVNESKYPPEITNPPLSKTVRIHSEYENYRKASSLSSWLFIKYDMSYKTYRNKSKARRDALREEYMADTGNSVNTNLISEYEDAMTLADAMDLLASIGVPFDPMGNPIGCGWDD